MNYRHIYHAGNFADVFKHIVLIALIQSLLRKDKAFGFLDTHAGSGSYDLLSSQSQKSQEYLNGIEKILQAKNPPPLVQDYIACIQKTNPSKDLRYYPGSPLIVRQLLRPQDRMTLTELHLEEYQILKRVFPHDKQVGIHHQDGYQALKAFLPLKERRGLVLIDPPYEKPDELNYLTTQLREAIEKWETGIFAVWYPIKDQRSIQRFHHLLKQKISHSMLITELCIYPENQATQLNGSGMIIVNPPWLLEEQLQSVLPWLWTALSPEKKGKYVNIQLSH